MASRNARISPEPGFASPERTLWQAVIMTAALDAGRKAGADGYDNYHFRQARGWFEKGGPDFELACNLAGMDAEFLQDAYRAGKFDDVKSTARRMARER